MKTIVVTGGAQGIGKGIVLALLNADYNVSVWDIDREACDELSQEFYSPDILQTLTIDVSKEDEVKQATFDTLNKFKSVYGLVNNAGISQFTPFETLELNEWNHILSVNLTSVFLCSQQLLPYIKQSKGCIVNMASTRALQSEPQNEIYSATKGAIISLTHAMANSLGPNVRVNCISPGWIDTTSFQKSANKKNVLYSNSEHEQHPCGRIGTPSDIANMIIFLLNSTNSFITSQNFVIDGGMTHKMIYL